MSASWASRGPAAMRSLPSGPGAWSKAGGKDILLLDEMLVVALAEHHPHYLADEQWNCPADEKYRSIDPAEAKILHFFLDGAIIDGRRIGRNVETWTGRQWFEAYRAAKADIDLSRWRLGDEYFPRDAERPFESGAKVTIRLWLKDCERAIRRGPQRHFPPQEEGSLIRVSSIRIAKRHLPLRRPPHDGSPPCSWQNPSCPCRLRVEILSTF